MNHTRYTKKALAIGTAAAILATASTFAVAAPIGSGQLALKNAASSDVTEVGWKGRRNTAIALGALGGLFLGGALAHGHYASPYSYSYGAYPYAYPYAYVAPQPRRCLAWDPYRHRNVWVYC
ncbi:MAG: hypothetical protein WD871_10860 [Xanthobacteraceae bacterium]